MVRLTPKSPGPVALVFLVLLGAWAIVTGVLLALRADTALGVVGALLLVVLGPILLAPVALRVTERWWGERLPPARRTVLDGEEADFHPRRTGWPTPLGFSVLGALGLWAAAIAIIGTLQENWGWALFVVPAVYFLGFPVLWLSGRLRPGGVWVTPTRVVDEHLGLRSELATRDVDVLSPWATELAVVPHEGVMVEHQTLTPKPWRARLVEDRLVIDSEHLAGGSEALAAAIQPLLDSRRRG